MFLEEQPKSEIDYYWRMLEVLGSLSRLMSESDTPYLQYRMVENLYCRAFGADNLARSDVSFDAKKSGVGIGIKTFYFKKGHSREKVAEFNRESPTFRDLAADEMVRKVSEYRNDRIMTHLRLCGVKEAIYHCVTRKPGEIVIYETPMDLIDVENIKNVTERETTIQFEDGKSEYTFMRAKSTLAKEFVAADDSIQIPVDIVKDPFAILEKLMGLYPDAFEKARTSSECVVLPLYSAKAGKRFVPEKSGLNQWNASGRSRDADEVYISIPAWIHKKFPGFFPAREQPFNLWLPDGTRLDAKVCQENCKALMSNPNKALGKWLLRDVLHVPEGKLLSYERLQSIGLDSVMVCKSDEDTYRIDFKTLGTYDRFKEQNF